MPSLAHTEEEPGDQDNLCQSLGLLENPAFSEPQDGWNLAPPPGLLSGLRAQGSTWSLMELFLHLDRGPSRPVCQLPRAQETG